MATKRISVIDLSQSEEAVKTSRKRAKNLTALKAKVDVVKDQPTTEAKSNTALQNDVVKITDDTSVTDTAEHETEVKTNKKATKQKDDKKVKHSHRYNELVALIDKQTLYPIDEAAVLVKQTAKTKFIGSVDAHLVTNQKGIRGFVALPHYTSSKKKILVFGNVKQDENILVGNDQTIKEIEDGKLSPGKDFNIVIANPEYMPKLAKVAKILGPKGLMPNPKSGTVTTDPNAAIKDLNTGKLEYKSESDRPVIHIAIGKTNLNEKQITENVQALIDAIGMSKIIKLSINSSMAPSVKVKVA